ncbi:hypothetical protein ACPUVO_03990 [Pseudocolwellia sp. HL-MZ19]|uniref:hypothetical protein n=1 Tax=Pseudocolwellia sp. HL-MZ19 TaxID=3400846 RepID=UPI003CEA53D8
MSNISSNTKSSIFCKIESEEDLLHVIRKHLHAEASLKSEQTENSYVIKVENLNTIISFHISIRKIGGDKISKRLLGAYNYAKKIESSAEGNKDFILERISRCNASIGVIFEPEDIENFGHLNYLKMVSEEFNGLIFNGSDFIDSAGDLVLSKDGEFTVIYE